ncbi:MAG: IMP cyclohydrolase [Oscillospiraceae bacterium]
MQNLFSLLKNNPYPGRGLLIGQTTGGEALFAYFIMGRSENSRNRVFKTKGQNVYTQAANPALLIDPSLIIYAPVRCVAGGVVVGNGDQTDTIAKFLQQGKTFEEALRTRTFEPDAPIYTPRISGMIEYKEEEFCYRLSILKSAASNPDVARRFFYEYPQPLKGVGHFIHTYASPTNPLPSFAGEPIEVAINGNAESFANELWQVLDEENKISLVVRRLQSLAQQKSWLYNKYKEV